MPATSDTTDFSYATPASPDTADLTGATSSNSKGSLFSATTSGLQTLDIVLTNILSDNKKIAVEPYNVQYTLSDGTTGYSALHYATRLETLGIGNLGNVTITGTPADNEVLAYDTTSSKWINQTAAEANIVTSADPVITGTISGNAFLDEDDMSSDSAVKVASQQSIKAYVDSQVTAQDLDFQGDAGGALSIDLDSETLILAGGTGITTTGSNNTMTFAVDAAQSGITSLGTLTGLTVNNDITAKDSDGALIYLQSTDTSITTGDVLGGLSFSAPDESSGGIGDNQAAYIFNRATENFTDTKANSKLQFGVGSAAGAITTFEVLPEGEISVYAGNRNDDSGNPRFPAINFYRGTTSFNGQGSTIFSNADGQLCFGMDADKSKVVFFLDDEDGQPIFTFQEEDGTDILDGGDTDVTVHKPLIVNSTITTTGNIELGHATANTLSASSGVLSIEGKSIVDTGGTGLTKSSSTLSVDASQTQITSIGTIGTGTWQGTAIADSYIASASTWNSKQAGDAGLTSISGLTTAADKMIYTTGSDAYAVTDLTSTARTLLDDASTSAMRTTLGLGTSAILDSVDEDNMASNSATLVPTQQSVKAYVDSVVEGLDVKNSVRVATTANITPSGALTIDGVSLSNGDRVLLKDQSTGSQNGVYVVNTGDVWERATDFDSNTEVTDGTFFFVEQGTVNADSGWVLTTNNPITVGTTALVFSQFSGAGQITAGTGLSKSGNTLSVNASQTQIDAVGTIGTGTWQGTAIADNYISSASTWNAKQAALTFGKSDTNALKLEEDVTTNDILLAGSSNVKGRTYAELKSDLTLNNVENTALSSWAGTSNITTLGTIATGVWNGTAIADSYISSASTWNAKQSALTFGIANTNAVKIDDADAAENDYARLTASGIEGRSYAEVKTDLSLGNVENTALSTWTGSSNITTVGTLTSATIDGDVTFTGASYDVVWDKSDNALEFDAGTKATFGGSQAFKIYHTASSTYITNTVGHINLSQYANDCDIILSSDDGSGGLANYILLDGSEGEVKLYHAASGSSSVKLTTKSGGVDITGTLTYDSLSDGTITITGFVDEDNMSSDSATLVPTQQSVKAYVDANSGGSVSGAQTAITSITNANLVVGRDADNDIDFATDNEIIFRAGGADQIKLTDGALVPITDNDIDLGASGAEFKNLYLDGQLVADYINNSGNLINGGYINNTGYLWQTTDTAIMYWGANYEVRLTHVHNTGLQLYLDNQLLFRDNDINIGSPADGDLDINADAEIELNSTLIDINGAVDISGTTTLNDDVTFIGGSYNAVWDSSQDSLEFADNAKATFGSGRDLLLYHNGSSSVIENYTGALYITNRADDQDIFIRTDNSTGGFTSYVKCEGSTGEAQLFHYGSEKLATKSTGIDVTGAITADGLTIGVDDTGYDVKFFGATSGKYMEWDESADQLDVTGSLDVTGNTSMVGTLTVGADDTGHDVKFFGATSGKYMLWDESANNLRLTVDSKLDFRNGSDNAGLWIYHDSSANHSYIYNWTGDLNLFQTADDKDIVLWSDDGSGSIAYYLKCDGSNGEVQLYHYGSEKLNTLSTGIQITGTIELGHASDTTISRASAGVIAVEGKNLSTVDDATALAIALG